MANLTKNGKKMGRPTKAEQRKRAKEREARELDVVEVAKGGRPPGMTAAKASAKIAGALAARMARTGEPTPLEVMTDNVNFFKTKSDEFQLRADSIIPETYPKGKKRDDAARQKVWCEKEAISFRIKAQTAAEAAAPFMHAKIQSVSLKGAGNGPQVIVFTGDDAKA